MDPRLSATVVLAAALITVGCGGGGGGGSTVQGGGQGSSASNGNNNPPLVNATRTFNLNNNGSSTYAAVTTSVGTSDGDLTMYLATLGLSAPPARDESTAKALRSSPTGRRHDVMHRNLPRQSSGLNPVTVIYDQTPTLNFYISETNTNVTLFNRTPGVLGNPGTEPRTIVTYVEQVGGVDCINATDLQKAVNAWETSNPFGPQGNTGIYSTTRGIFGSEWTAGGGNDGDPRIVCCFLSTATLGSDGLFGYVDIADESAPRGQSFDGTISNGGEIIYLHAQPSSLSNFFQADGFDGYATMAHELEHLIIYNTKFAQQGTFPAGAQQDSPTIDEGNATLSEDDNGFSLTASGGGNSFIFDVIDYYETTAPNTNNFLSFSTSGADYGKGYLFFKYIQDQLGVATISAISQSTQTGTANIAAHVGQSFGNQQQAWALANYVSSFASGGAPYRYNSLNLSGTYLLHMNNDPTQAFSSTLPGMRTTQTLNGGSTIVEEIIALGQNYVAVLAGSGSGTLTVNAPSNIQTSLVQVENGAVVNVTY
jgi:hypothetical protein